MFTKHYYRDERYKLNEIDLEKLFNKNKRKEKLNFMFFIKSSLLIVKFITILYKAKKK